MWHSGKFRAFVGVICFTSKNPLRLPWTTTKRGLNQESPVWQHAKLRAEVIGKQVTSFIDSLYRKDEQEKPDIAALQDSLTSADIREVVNKKGPAVVTFTASAPTIHASSADRRITISYSVGQKAVDAVKVYLRNPRLANGKVGKHTFNYFLSSHDLGEVEDE